MTVLSSPRRPLVDDALELARLWCTGHVIDGSPALAHAVKVALTLDRHLIHPEPELIAAALLHDAPFFAPTDMDLDSTLSNRLGPAVTLTIRALEREHDALDGRAAATSTQADPWTLYAIAADKVVALSAILHRASRADDPVAYWGRRGAFITRVPYFRAFADHAANGRRAASHTPDTKVPRCTPSISHSSFTTSTGSCLPSGAGPGTAPSGPRVRRNDLYAASMRR